MTPGYFILFNRRRFYVTHPVRNLSIRVGFSLFSLFPHCPEFVQTLNLSVYDNLNFRVFVRRNRGKRQETWWSLRRDRDFGTHRRDEGSGTHRRGRMPGSSSIGVEDLAGDLGTTVTVTIGTTGDLTKTSRRREKNFLLRTNVDKCRPIEITR